MKSILIILSIILSIGYIAYYIFMKLALKTIPKMKL